jgi:D-alanyl-D-alanine carboxypeptidase
MKSMNGKSKEKTGTRAGVGVYAGFILDQKPREFWL